MDLPRIEADLAEVLADPCGPAAGIEESGRSGKKRQVVALRLLFCAGLRQALARRP
jgi:hypothetical protein